MTNTPRRKPPTPPTVKVGRSLTAAARRISGRKLKRQNANMGWGEEAWYHYDVCGELHFLAGTVANAMSMVELYISRKDAESGGWVRVDDDADPGVMALDALAGDSPTGMAEMLRRFGLNEFIVGDAYLIGHPHEDAQALQIGELPYIDTMAVQSGLTMDLASLCWRVYAAGEVKQEGGQLRIAGRDMNADDCVIIRVWRPHPRACYQSDSPVRAALPLLRELEGLTKYVSAILDSRFAGAGIVWMPEGATIVGAASPEEVGDSDPFLEGVMAAMMEPVRDRDSAASLVPIFATLPDDIAWQPEHMKFSSELDMGAKELRDEAIRRLALSLDAPPEILLGMGQSNHWSSFQLAEDFVKLHILPVVGMIRDALVREYLRPVLEANGIKNPQDYTIEADTTALTLRPNRSSEAMALNAAGLITDAVTREALGFGEEDAPEKEPVDDAVTIALDMLRASPSLAVDPGLPALTNQLRQILGIPVVAYEDLAPEPAPVRETITPATAPAPDMIPTQVEPGPPVQGA